MNKTQNEIDFLYTSINKEKFEQTPRGKQLVQMYFDLWNDSNKRAEKLSCEVANLKSLLDKVIRNQHTVNDKLLDKILIALGR